VFHYRDSTDSSVAVEVGWDGRVRGRLPLPAGVRYWQQSPDGSLLLVQKGNGLDASVVAPDGRVLTNVAGDATWSDDSRHLCAIADANGRFPVGTVVWTAPSTSLTSFPPTYLYLDSVDGTARRIGTAIPFTSHTDGAAHCSVASDRAVLVANLIGTHRVDSVVRLSSGRRVAFDPADSSMVAVSPDTRYIAEANQFGSMTTIRDMTTGRVVGRLGPGEVVAISSSGKVAVQVHPGTVRPPGTPPPSPSVDMVELATGRAIWSSPGYRADLVGDPSGSAFAIGVMQQGSHLEDVWLVHGDGRAVLLAQRVQPVASP
jgi:hypothetical protein